MCEPCLLRRGLGVQSVLSVLSVLSAAIEGRGFGLALLLAKGQEVRAHILGSLPVMWETPIEFLASGLLSSA